MTIIQLLIIVTYAVISTPIIVMISRYFLEGEEIFIKEAIGIGMLLLTVGALTISYSYNSIQDLIMMLFIVIVGVIDYHTKSIVSAMMYLGGILFVILAFSKGMLLKDVIFGGISGFVIYGLIYFIAKAIYKKEAFGFGDVMFMCVIGLYLGVKLTLLAALLTFYVALIWILISKIIGSVVKRQMEIAFAPFMSVSCIITALFGEEIIKLYMTLFMV